MLNISRKKQPHRKPAKNPNSLELAERSIRRIAEREQSTPEQVRKHIQVAMLSGLLSETPSIREQWQRIPCSGEIPTPEELIAYYVNELGGR